MTCFITGVRSPPVEPWLQRADQVICRCNQYPLAWQVYCILVAVGKWDVGRFKRDFALEGLGVHVFLKTAQ